MIYKLQNGGIIKLQNAGSLPKWMQKLNSWSIPDSDESAGERVLNSTIEQANDATTQEERDKIYKNKSAATLATTALSLSPYVFTNPALMRTLDVIGTIDGIHNLTTDNGIKKTIRLVNQKDYGKAFLSGVGDTFDLIGAGDAIRMISKIRNRAYRGYHAFNTIVPYAYENPLQRGKQFVKSMLLEKKYKSPVWKNGSEENRYLSEAFGRAEWQKAKSRLAREDAFAIYTGQVPKNGMYIKNPNGTYSYNLDKFEGQIIKRPEDWLAGKYDYLGYTHGGLHDVKHFPITTIVIDPKNSVSTGNIYIKDIWDLNPFERQGDALSLRMNKYLKDTMGTKKWRELAQKFRSYMYNKGHWDIYGESPKTTIGKITKWMDSPLNQYRSGFKSNWEVLEDGTRRANPTQIKPFADTFIDKFTNSKFMKNIDKKFNKMEVGPILGGKPFTMETTIPYRQITNPEHPWSMTIIEK